MWWENNTGILVTHIPAPPPLPQNNYNNNKQHKTKNKQLKTKLILQTEILHNAYMNGLLIYVWIYSNYWFYLVTVFLGKECLTVSKLLSEKKTDSLACCLTWSVSYKVGFTKCQEWGIIYIFNFLILVLIIHNFGTFRSSEYLISAVNGRIALICL